MPANRFTRNLSANTLQLLINQFFGLIIFFSLSKGLDKNIFGELNWCLAVLLAVFALLSFGIDQVVVKKIAAGYNRQSVFTAYLFHVIVSGSLFYGLLLLLYLLAPHGLPAQPMLLLIAIGKLGIFFSTPLKQLANGLEKFSLLLSMSVVSNIVRGAALLALLLLHAMSAAHVLVVFIAGDLLELLLCIFIARPLLGASYKIKPNTRRQWLLLKESLPQTGVVIFTAIMSRLDWILVGLLVSSAKLAEYSFAWKAWEVSTLPLLIIAPIMIPLFTRVQNLPGNIIGGLSFFLEWQIIVASLTALLLNICWTPVIDFITDGKYGAVNASTIFLLSIAIPFLYFNNYLWTINFARGHLKQIFFILGISFAVNMVACCILIPIYKNEGAAIAYVITLLVQMALYLQKNPPAPAIKWYLLCRWPLSAVATGLLIKSLGLNWITTALLVTAVYSALVFASRQVRTKDWKLLQSLYQ
jgi:O-antigen/teichoic acid export membrane protein